MTSKRENYISLLSEFNEVKKTNTSNTLEENLKELKNYIFDLAFKKIKSFLILRLKDVFGKKIEIEN